MVWSRGQCGTFLTAIEDERLYRAVHARRLLRAAPLGAVRPGVGETDLATRRIHVRQAQVDDELDSTKSEDSDRIVTIDQDTANVLKAWRKAQLAERLAWGSAWTDTGRVFTREDGTPLRPGWVQRAVRHARRPGRGCRRSASTICGTARPRWRSPPGVPLKAISEMLGHATSAFTADVYTEVAEELAEAAASKISAFVRRGTINGPSGGRDDR